MSADDADTVQGETIGSVRELREYATGRLDTPHSDVHEIAGLIDDPEARETYLFMAENYDRTIYPDEVAKELPRRFEDTVLARRFLEKHATDTATKAIQDGNLSQVAYITGMPSYKPDVSGMHAIDQLEDWLVNSEQCKLIYCAALMGRGKTDFSLLLFEIINRHYSRLQDAGAVDVPDPEFACNFHAYPDAETDAHIEEIHSYSELQEWADGGSSDDEKWFIFDEASTELTAQSGANAQDVAEVFAPFVKKMRKSGVNMIVIGHDRGDVHPAIRAIASFLDKTGTKTAEIYEGISSREPHGHLMSLSGIPETGWDYDTDDVADWTWDEEIETGGEDDPGGISEQEWNNWRDSRIAAVYDATDLNQTEVGELFGVSQAKVSNAVNTFDSVPFDTAPEHPEAALD